MTEITLRGTPVTLQGNFPAVGDKAADFTVVLEDLSTTSLSELIGAGKQVVLNIIPSTDTPTCAQQLKTFNSKVSPENTVILFVSLDLPFAYKRFRITEGIDNAMTGSDFKEHQLAQHYGVQMVDGPLAGVYARAVLVINTQGIITHAELVTELSSEPDYDKALLALHG